MLRPEPSAPKTFITMAYNPVIKPILKGKFILIMPGINTLPIAIARPINTVPVNRNAMPVIDRTKIPIISKANEIAIVRSIPIRFAILGANGESKANASKGKVVIDPASALLIPRSSRINDTSAPAEVKGTRRFAPTKITPIIKSQVFFVVGEAGLIVLFNDCCLHLICLNPYVIAIY